MLGDSVFEHVGELKHWFLSVFVLYWFVSTTGGRRCCLVSGELVSLDCQHASYPAAALSLPRTNLHHPTTPLHPAGDLLQQRASVAANVRRLVAGFREAEAAEKAAAAMPSYGSTVTVMSESQVRVGGRVAGLVGGWCLGGRWPCRLLGSRVGSLVCMQLSARRAAHFTVYWSHWVWPPALKLLVPAILVPPPQKLMHSMERCTVALPANHGLFHALSHFISPPQKLMHKLERKAQRRAAGKGGAGGSAAPKEQLGDEDADWVRCGSFLHMSRVNALQVRKLGDEHSNWDRCVFLYFGLRLQHGERSVRVHCWLARSILLDAATCNNVQPTSRACAARLPRSAHGLMPLVEEEVERETAHMRLRWVARMVHRCKGTHRTRNIWATTTTWPA